MLTGISTACFYPMQVEDAAELIISLGFKNVEVFINTESEYDDEFIVEMKYRFDEAGVRVLSLHPCTSIYEATLFFSGYERRLRDGLAAYERYFRAAKRLGADFFIFHGAKAAAPYEADPLSRVFRLNEAEKIAYKRLCSLAGDSGITFTQENVSWCRSRSPEYIKDLAELTGDGLGFTLDIKQAVRAGYSPETYIDAMGGNIANVHISDYSRESTCLLPLRGHMDYPAFFKLMEGCGYKGAYLIEVYREAFGEPEETREAGKALEKIADSLARRGVKKTGGEI